ncbi:hypothetical protein D9M68_545500 [compost metagenome]
MGVVGEDAATAATLLRGNGPVVGRGDAEHVERGDLPGGIVQCREAGNLPAQLQALELLCLLEGERLIRVDGRQPGQLVGANLLRHDEGGDLFLQVHRQAEVQQGENKHRVFRFPVGRLVAGLGQVHRQLVAVAIEVGVDAAGVDREELLQAWRGILVEDVGALAQVHRAHEAVDLQHAGAGHLGQASFGHQAQADHLAEAVGGVDVAEAEQGVVEGGGFDQRHAQRVAADRDALRQALHRLEAGGGRQAVGVAAVQPGLAAAEADHGASGGGNAEPGKEALGGWRSHGTGSPERGIESNALR